MPPALHVAGRPFYALRIDRPEAFALPFAADAYACLLVAGAPADDPARADLADRLLLSGCRYAVCAGVDCVAWEYAVDDAVLGLEFDDLLAPGTAVITTSHADEPLADVAHFVVCCTGPEGPLRDAPCLVLLVGASEADEGEVLACLAREAAFGGLAVEA